MKECKICGAKMNNKAKFCPTCGEGALDLPILEIKNYNFLRKAVKEYYQEVTKGINPEYFTFTTRTITVKDQTTDNQVTITNFPQTNWKYSFFESKECSKLVKNMIKINKLHEKNGVYAYIELSGYKNSSFDLVTFYHGDDPKELIMVERTPFWAPYDSEEFKTFIPLISPEQLGEFIFVLSSFIERKENYIKDIKEKLSRIKKFLKEIQILDKKYEEERIKLKEKEEEEKIKQEKKEEIASLKQEAKVSPNQITLDKLFLEEAEE